MSADATLAANGSRSDHLVVYERKHGWAALDLRELWSYRELLYFLTWRDVLIRYKQAVLGVAWAILQPFLTMIVFTVVFNRALGVQSPDPSVPYRRLQLLGTAGLAVLRRGSEPLRDQPRRVTPTY